MSIQRRRKNNKSPRGKKSPHYGFLVSWHPDEAKMSHVKGETALGINSQSASHTHVKRADSLAQAEAGLNVKRSIIRSLITIGLILILELVIYLAWIRIVK